MPADLSLSRKDKNLKDSVRPSKSTDLIVPPAAGKDVASPDPNVSQEPRKTRNFPRGYYKIPGSRPGQPEIGLLFDWVGDMFGFEKVKEAPSQHVPPAEFTGQQSYEVPNANPGKTKSGCQPCQEKRLLRWWLKIRWVGVPKPIRWWKGTWHILMLIFWDSYHPKPPSYPGCGCIWKLRMGAYLFKQFWTSWKNQ